MTNGSKTIGSMKGQNTGYIFLNVEAARGKREGEGKCTCTNIVLACVHVSLACTPCCKGKATLYKEVEKLDSHHRTRVS